MTHVGMARRPTPDNAADESRGTAEIELNKTGLNTITSKKALRDELDQVVEAGFAVNDEELAPELCAISLRVRDEAHEVIAAVNMVVHASMISLEELVDALGPHLVSTADPSLRAWATGTTTRPEAAVDVWVTYS